MKKMIPVALISLVVAAALAVGLSQAREPQWYGLAAVAVDPTGKIVVTGGQSRTLFVLDAATLEVKQRIWIGARIGNLAFNKDGTRLAVEGDDNSIRFFDPKEWKMANDVDRLKDMNVAAAADLFAAFEEDWEKPKIRFLSLTDGTRKGMVTLTEPCAAFALDAEGKKLAVLTYAKEEGEAKKEWSEKPEELQGLAEKEWFQKNNGETCKLLLFEVPSGKPLGEFKSWYTSYPGNAEIVVQAEDILVINYDNCCAKFDAKGEITLFETLSASNTGRGTSPDKKVICTGGLREGAYTTLEGLKGVKFEIDEIPGFENFEGFCFAADGTVFAVTSGFRIVKIGKDGAVVKVSPVY